MTTAERLVGWYRLPTSAEPFYGQIPDGATPLSVGEAGRVFPGVLDDSLSPLDFSEPA